MLLKARHDYLTGGRSPILHAILTEVLESVPVANSWWSDPEVVRIGETVIDFREVRGESQKLRLSVLASEDRRGLRVVVYTPAPD